MSKPIIEKGIKPVCDVLNSIPGVKTLWSCEGHPERPAAPYVTFMADTGFAYSVYKMLGRAAAHNELDYCWRLRADFIEGGELQYTIESNDVRVLGPRRSWLNLFVVYHWSKSEMDRELLRLANLLKGMPSYTVNE